jgi:hypothetical protein
MKSKKTVLILGKKVVANLKHTNMQSIVGGKTKPNTAGDESILRDCETNRGCETIRNCPATH